jgi:hypothetical protein
VKIIKPYWNGFITDQLSDVYNGVLIYNILLLLLSSSAAAAAAATYEPYKELLKCNHNLSTF